MFLEEQKQESFQDKIQDSEESLSDLIELEDIEWEAETIVAFEHRNGDPHYLIHWKDCPDCFDSWEPERDCGEHKDQVDAFWGRLIERYLFDYRPSTS